MADRKISDLTALTTPAAGDYLPIIDISEPLAANKNKRITIEELLRGAPDGTAGAPGIAFESDPDTGLYSTGANAVAISTGGTGRLFVDASGNVGINVASPTQARLVVASSAGANTGYFTDGTNSTIKFVHGGGGAIITTESGQYLGIGTSDAERLRITSTGQIQSAGLGSAASPALSFTTDTNTGIYSPGADQVAISTNGTGRVFVDASGNVGVGVSPAARLHIYGTYGYFQDGTYDGYFGKGNGVVVGAGASDLGISSATGAIAFGTGASLAERLRITSDGKVGLGTSSPSVRLQVQDSIAGGSDGTVATLHNFSDTGADTRYVGLNFRIGSDNGTSAIRAHRTNSATNYETNLSFWTNPAGATQTPLRAMTIDSYQRVGVGTSTPTENLTIYGSSSRLAVTGGSGSSAILIGNQNSSGANNPSVIEAANGNLYFGGGNSWSGGGTFDYTMTLTDDGKVGVGVTTPNASLHVNSSYTGYGGAAISDGSPLFAITGGQNKTIRIDGGAYQGGTSTANLHLSNSASSNFNVPSGYLLQASSIDNGSTNSSNFTISSSFYSGSAYTYTERLRITSGGAVGIGTSSPQVLVHGTTSVSNSTEYAGVAFFENSLNNVDTSPTTAFPVLKLTRAGKSGVSYRSSASFGIARYENPGTQARSRLDIALGHGDVAQPDTTVMSLLSSGAVGVGTTGPAPYTAGAIPVHVHGGANAAEFRLTTDSSGQSSATDGAILQLSGTSLALWNAENDAIRFGTNNQERARIDSSGRLGIGTTSPARLLHVNASSANTYGIARISGTSRGGQIEFATDSTVNAGIFSPSIDALVFFTSAAETERARIDSSGRLLVGTSSSSAEAKFIVQGGTTAAGGVMNIQRSATTASAGSTIGLINFTNSANDLGASIAANGDGTWSAGTSHPTNLTFSTTADGASSPTERLRIDSSGRVGIGTSSIAGKLHISTSTTYFPGNIFNDGCVLIGSASDRLALSSDSTYGANITALEPGIVWKSLSLNSNQTIFNTNGFERARIDASGRLLVGTPTAFSAGGDAQYGRLHMVGNTSVSTGHSILALGRGEAAAAITTDEALGYITFSDNAGNTFASIHSAADANAGSGDYPGRLVFSTTADGASSPTERLRIDSAGTATFSPASATGAQIINVSNNVTAVSFRISGTQYGYIQVATSGTTYSTASDYRIKENVVAVTDGITRLQQLKPSRFNFITDPDKTVDGFIAHEVQDIVPEAITGEKDAVDADGKPIHQGIDQSKLVPLLTAALQEAIGRIETLEAKVAALEGA